MYEYEIAYHVTFSKRIGKKVIRREDAQPPIATSRWLAPHPVAWSGFVMRELQARRGRKSRVKQKRWRLLLV